MKIPSTLVAGHMIKEASAVAAVVAPSVQTHAQPSDLSHVLKQPRITEKATIAASMNVYVFNVAMNANKRDIARAVTQYYKVIPRMVRVVSIPEKSVRSMRTGKSGVKQGGKKAYVYLKRGESITLA